MYVNSGSRSSFHPNGSRASSGGNLFGSWKNRFSNPPISNPSTSPYKLPGSSDVSQIDLHAAPHRSICLKAFAISVVVIGAIGLVTGVLALLSSQGILPAGLNGISDLAKIGMVNSYLMIFGGFTLFALGIVAWARHLHTEAALHNGVSQ